MTEGPCLLNALGNDELTMLQSHVPLCELFTLRTASKSARTALDATAPPAVALVCWILEQDVVNLSKSYNEHLPGYDPTRKGDDALNKQFESMCYQPTMIHASTRVQLDAFDLLFHATDGMRDEVTRDRFCDRWLNLARISLCGRSWLAVEGDGGGNTPPMNDAERVALLNDLFDSGFVHPQHKRTVYYHVRWNLFVYTAVRRKLHVLKFLAERDDVDVHWRALGGNNAYAIARNGMNSKLTYYEECEREFPSADWFDNVRPGETYAEYIARYRALQEAKYRPVLAYLRDELGLDTRPMRYDSPSSSGWVVDQDIESEDGESEDGESEDGESEDGDADAERADADDDRGASAASSAHWCGAWCARVRAEAAAARAVR